ncbi:mitochondrial protein Pet127-domain-containing protein [Rhodocollybia butyracea]|uniref:Mitochondrial protein Pet127-domain-containing protein n=1 Tax=Rhodocollybia butyracea TaxID=206335 RepID=A0A9P5Q3A0_9AGAR|nr:mitochondrial protein Pet127-domain-containing protein [Rhodocollybia butyracea]
MRYLFQRRLAFKSSLLRPSFYLKHHFSCSAVQLTHSSSLAARLRILAKANSSALKAVNSSVTEALEKAPIWPGYKHNRKERRKQRAAEKRAAGKAQIKSSPGEWSDDWGRDTLTPSDSDNPSEAKGSSSETVTRSSPPHSVPPSRQVEGLLEDIPKTVLEDLTPPTKQNPVATLHHGLERVLFNPGVHWLRDPLSRVYNFHPSLGIIPKITDFAFERLDGFTRSSRDQDLWNLAQKEGRKFGGSTSSLSGMLCHIYFLLSGNKAINITTLSSHFRKGTPTFTPGQRMAAVVTFNHNNGVYAIDSLGDESDKADKNILLWMGHLLEKYLTTPSENFLSYMRSQLPPPPKNPDGPTKEAYRYSKSEKYVMRSQLDCHDTRLPGTGVFDIKTRACLPLRFDLLNFKESSGYMIRQNIGWLESFEREYYDLIRSAFLKYQFQARIGNMDGVFVAYHNTARMFGFQYIPLTEMDQRLFGETPGIGDRVFQKCIEMLEVVSEEIISCFPGESVKCTFETGAGMNPDMNIWVEPLDWKVPYGINKTDAGAKLAPPVEQIVVSANSFYGESPAKGGKCVETPDRPWTVHWTVSRLAPEMQNKVREDLQGAMTRRYRPSILPSGVPKENIEEWWNSVDFNGSKKLQLPLKPIDDDGSEGFEVNSTTADQLSGTPVDDAKKVLQQKRDKAFFENGFISPDSLIQGLRDLAIAGREETIRLALEERGTPKAVLGVGEVDWEDPLIEEELEYHLHNREAAARAQQIHEIAQKSLEEISIEDAIPAIPEAGSWSSGSARDTTSVEGDLESRWKLSEVRESVLAKKTEPRGPQ